MFCQVCIDKAFRVLMVCPVCKLPYGVTQGNQPPGRMNWHESSSSLPGYQGYGTIIINYSFQSGIQGPSIPILGSDTTEHPALRTFPIIPRVERCETS